MPYVSTDEGFLRRRCESCSDLANTVLLQGGFAEDRYCEPCWILNWLKW